MAFKRATKRQSKLRLAVTGPAGSGKTYTALKLARAIVGPEGRIAVLDTEHGSASKYADVVEFDSDDSFAPPWHPDKFVSGLKAAADAGYDVLVIDSLSHAWAGQGGLLEEVDHIAARSKSGNSFTAWKDATPIQHRLIEGILAAPMHVVVTMRSKTEWILDSVTRNGKTVQQPRRVGMAPVQRDGVDYEFDVVLDMDHDHRGVVTKSRCSAVADAVIDKPGDELASALRAWLDDGAAQPAPADTPPAADADATKRLRAYAADESLPENTRRFIADKLSAGLSFEAAAKLAAQVEAKLAERAGQ